MYHCVKISSTFLVGNRLTYRLVRAKVLSADASSHTSRRMSGMRACPYKTIVGSRWRLNPVGSNGQI